MAFTYDMNINIKIPLGEHIINILYVSYIPSTLQFNYDFHSHSYYELHYVPQGKGTLFLSDKIYKIIPGSYYLTGPGVYHKQTSDADMLMSEYGIMFELIDLKSINHLADSYCLDEYKEITREIYSKNFWFSTDKYENINLFEKIFSEYNNKLLGYYNNIRNYLFTIIINSLRCYKEDYKSKYNVPGKTLDDKRRVLVDNYFRNYMKDLSVYDLANILGLGYKQVNRVLMKYFGMTFQDKLNNVRIDIAKILLLNSLNKLEDIGFKVGFNSYSYFNRVFKKMTDISPSDFRNNFLSKH